MSVANAKQVIAAGFDTAFVAVLDADGYFGGATGTISPGATGSAALQMTGVKTANLQIPDAEVVTATGDDGVLGTLIFPPNTFPSFDIQVGQMDLSLEALFQGTKVHDIGNSSFGVLQPSVPEFPDLVFLGLRRAVSRASGSLGQKAWQGVLIPKVNIFPKNTSGFTERQVSDFTYRVVCNATDKYPFGLALSEANNGALGAVMMPFTSPNRLGLYGWIGDNSTTVFNLAKSALRLVGTTLTQNVVHKEGVVVSSGLTIDTTPDPQTFTFTVAPAAAARVIALAEFLK